MYTNTRKIAEEYRLSHWAKVMQARSESGMSIKAFCKAEGFHENVYYYWQRKLREAACQERITKPQNKASEKDSSLVPKGWAVCENSKPVDTGEVLPIEVNGCRILVKTDVDPQLLTKVCRVLVTL